MIDQYKILRLEENFRSGKAICRAASNLISHNKDRIPKAIIPARSEEGIVAVRMFETERQEEAFVTNHIADLAFDTEPKPSIAILCRYQANGECQKWADALTNEGISVAAKRNPLDSLPEKWETLRTTFQFFSNPHSNYAAHKFLLTIWKKDEADQALIDAVKACKTLNDYVLNFPANPDTSPATLKKFLDSKSDVPLKTIDWLIEKVKEMPAGITMNDINLMLIETESAGADRLFDSKADVVVTTIHNAKSKEWDAVILPGWNEGFFPKGNDCLEEARRLAFVAITRARDSVLITASSERWTRYNGILRGVEPSRFLKEINEARP